MNASVCTIYDVQLPSSLARSRPLSALPEERSYSVFVLDAYLGLIRKRDGPACHDLLGCWLSTGMFSERDLRAWMGEALKEGTVRAALFDRSRSRADLWLRNSFAVALLKDQPPTPSQSLEPSYGLRSSGIDQSCPAVVYIKGSGSHLAAEPDSGSECSSPPLAALFNSRKPRQVAGREQWLEALRASLRHLHAYGAAIISSIEALTYDLAAAYATEASMPLCLVLPSPVDPAEPLAQIESAPFLAHALSCGAVLSCRSRSVSCPKATAMTCRDRLLARLADLHWILEIRAGGNLQAILEERSGEKPCHRYILLPAPITAQNQGNMRIIEARRKDPARWPVDTLVRVDVQSSPLLFDNARMASHPEASNPATNRAIDCTTLCWSDYLYHYTRSRPGPWPGQSYQSYLHGLLAGDSLGAHTALDTLIRIVSEGRIRAASGLVRGNIPVLSWTARPPKELSAIRQWNPALIRWTFEPYGIAVRKSLLRERGAKPTIYGREEAHKRLKPEDLFRFQLHEPPRCVWKQEREWRMTSDLLLADLPEKDWFIFVASERDAMRINGFSAVECVATVICVEALPGRAD